MYNVEKIKTDLIESIKSQIVDTIINNPQYNKETDRWEDSDSDTDSMEQTIEAVVYEFTEECYVALHITELHTDKVFGVYETSDIHYTDYFEYEDLDLEALYEISNYLEKLNN
jgi:hypothetical protein